jgi:hypothetical protein
MFLRQQDLSFAQARFVRSIEPTGHPLVAIGKDFTERLNQCRQSVRNGLSRTISQQNAACTTSSSLARTKVFETRIGHVRAAHELVSRILQQAQPKAL